jgi:hypothetical protein
MEELRKRIRLYLKARKEPVSRNELLKAAMKVGLSRDGVYTFCSEIQDDPDPEDINIGVWWGFKDNNNPKPHELKTLWLHYHELPEEEKKSWADDVDWFNKLWEEVVEEKDNVKTDTKTTNSK